MGYRQAAVLASVCFFFGKRVSLQACLILTSVGEVGVLFICLNVDYRILFMPLTEENISDGFAFYTTFYNSPPAIKVCRFATASWLHLNVSYATLGTHARRYGHGYHRYRRKTSQVGRQCRVF